MNIKNFISTAQNMGFLFTIKYKLGIAKEPEDFITLGQEYPEPDLYENIPASHSSTSTLHHMKSLNAMISDAQIKAGKPFPEHKNMRY